MNKTQERKLLYERVGTLSVPSKMPCSSYSIPALECKLGTKLAKIKGSTCEGCYALERGMYRFKTTKKAMYKRFNSIDKEYWVEDMVRLITLDNKGDKNYFRWHDSGDIQSTEHLESICEIARRLPKINFWLPTREYKMVSNYKGIVPPNLAIRLSAHMNNRVSKKIDDAYYGSIVVDSEDIAKQLDKTTEKSVITCPATMEGSNRKCNECRSCWHFRGIIAYIKH